MGEGMVVIGPETDGARRRYRSAASMSAAPTS